MTEDLLQYLWKFCLYKQGIYSTHDGQALEIIHPGFQNADSGPDFFNAKVKIGKTLWAGNVEIHQKASDWYKHGHNANKAYDNVILHVVALNDTEVINTSGVVVPAWEMPVEPSCINNYNSLLRNQGTVACAQLLSRVNKLEVTCWIERVAIEKLEAKINIIHVMLQQNRNNWDEVFYVLLLRNFGFGINNQPFEQLARQTPWKTVLKNSDSILKLEALLLGQAGFLSGLVHEDDHVLDLVNEYRFLRHKYKLEPVPNHTWKFMRLRPSNFPTIRLAQLATLLYKGGVSVSRVISAINVETLEDMFNVTASGYWDTHYRPCVESVYIPKRVGKSSVELLIINTIAPIVFAYGKIRDNDTIGQRAIGWLETIKPESNKIIKEWCKTGIRPGNALQSQGLVNLVQNYCKHRKCLHCSLGHAVMSRNNG